MTEWIKCSERLPDNDQDEFLYNPTRFMVVIQVIDPLYFKEDDPDECFAVERFIYPASFDHETKQWFDWAEHRGDGGVYINGFGRFSSEFKSVVVTHWRIADELPDYVGVDDFVSGGATSLTEKDVRLF